MDLKTPKRPQHFLTLLPASKASDWPDEWKNDPEKIRLVTLHQQWLAQAGTELLHKILQAKATKLAMQSAQQATLLGGRSEDVRMLSAQLHVLVELAKTIYDTKQYVSEATGS